MGFIVDLVLILIVAVSLLTKKPSKEIEEDFDAVKAGKVEG